jgi:hypothetical protein
MLVLKMATSAVGTSLAFVQIAKLIITTSVCGNTIDNGGGPAIDGITDCNMKCSGNITEFCGAANRLDMYEQIG